MKKYRIEAYDNLGGLYRYCVRAESRQGAANVFCKVFCKVSIYIVAIIELW